MHRFLGTHVHLPNRCYSTTHCRTDALCSERTEVMSSHARTKKELQDMAEAMKVRTSLNEHSSPQDMLQCIQCFFSTYLFHLPLVTQLPPFVTSLCNTQVEFADAEADARQEYESAREEVRNRSSEEYNVLKLQLEGIIEELERHFEQVWANSIHTCRLNFPSCIMAHTGVLPHGMAVVEHVYCTLNLMVAGAPNISGQHRAPHSII